MQYNTIFFDLDDTLWDTETNSRESLEDIYHLFGFDNYYESFSDFWDVYFPFNQSLWHLYERNGITKSDLMKRRFFEPFVHMNGLTEAKAADINKAFMERTASKSRVIEGAFDVLDALKPNFRMCVLSNGFEEVQFKKIHNAGFDDYFEKVILSDHVGINKPDTRIFEYALKEMDVKKDNVVMIGDNWNSDILGAHNAGIDQIWFNPDGDPAHGFTPTYSIKALSEIKSILM